MLQFDLARSWGPSFGLALSRVAHDLWGSLYSTWFCDFVLQIFKKSGSFEFAVVWVCGLCFFGFGVGFFFVFCLGFGLVCLGWCLGFVWFFVCLCVLCGWFFFFFFFFSQFPFYLARKFLVIFVLFFALPVKFVLLPPALKYQQHDAALHFLEFLFWTPTFPWEWWK